MGKNKSLIILLTALSLALGACKNNRLDVDVSAIDASPVIYRFEEDIFGTSKASWTAKMNELRMRDSQFYDVFAYEFTYRNHYHDFQWGVYNDADSIYNFTQNELIHKLYEETHRMYGNLDRFKGELTQSLKYFKHHFPQKKIPVFNTMITEISTRVAPFEHCIGIGLDFFMGNDHGAYLLMSKEGKLTSYQLKRMTSDYLNLAAVQGLFEYHFNNTPADRTFLAKLIEEGKKQYFIDAMMPNAEDSIKLEYTKTQLDWANNNQLQMWNHFTDHKLFFSSDLMLYERFFEDGPFTSAPDVPHDSPPRLGVYAGWQIVKHYMDEHPEITLPQLLADKDYQKILKESGYKPR